MADLAALANLMPHTEWCVAEHYGPGLACDDPSCQNVRQDEAADLVANRDLLLVALEHAGVLREERPVPYEPVRRYVTPWQDVP